MPHILALTPRRFLDAPKTIPAIKAHSLLRCCLGMCPGQLNMVQGLKHPSRKHMVASGLF